MEYFTTCNLSRMYNCAYNYIIEKEYFTFSEFPKKYYQMIIEADEAIREYKYLKKIFLGSMRKMI